MDPDGSFSAYFDDDDMFFGHCVVVYGTLADGVTEANMEGRAPNAPRGDRGGVY